MSQAVGWKLSPDAARALYVAIMTDTGGFRFSNTSARALEVASALLQMGVSAEEVYSQVYATASEGRIRLMAEVLETLVVEPERGISWVTVPPGSFDRHAAESRRHCGPGQMDPVGSGWRLEVPVRLRQPR